MVKKRINLFMMLGISVLILAVLACGSIRVGVVTPTGESDEDQISDIAKAAPEENTVEGDPSEDVNPTQDVGDGERMDQPAAEEPAVVEVVAWLGHIASLPEGSQFDDVVILSPEGVGEFGLAGTTPELEAEIRTLRDATGPEEYVHLWGALSCEGDDYNGCQLAVDRTQYGAKQSEQEVKGWKGTIRSTTFNNAVSYVFELQGDFPMWYSIYASQDEALQIQIENLRDTNALVEVSGTLMVGIPDVNGTRIEVTELNVIEEGTGDQPKLDDTIDPTVDWPVFISDRYDYQIKYPPEATISLHGPVSFSSDELPEGMSPDQYLDQLLKTYTNQLCVQVEYALGTIYISAPPNQEKYYSPCGPTGVGAGEIIDQIETLYIGDQLYQAKGMEIRLQYTDPSGEILSGETLDLHSEMFYVSLEDGTRIFYGSMPNHDATYDDYLMKTKDTLLQIISTYEARP